MKTPPDTEIRCHVCLGTKVNNQHKCGACLETGLSTNPWDQRRKSICSTLRTKISHTDKTVDLTRDKPSDDVVIAMFLEKMPGDRFFGDVQVEDTGTPYRDSSGFWSLRGVIISWANPHYEENLKASLERLNEKPLD